uniref:Regulatory protein zeste n=1 Tax=Meloidogyne hapla TaxID=6305 RepID=A0A1I8C1L4_MELHA
MALFNKEMATELAQKISENSAELFPTNRDAASSRRSYNAWEAITEELNSQYGSSLTIAQCRDKYSVGTGGGPCINKKNDTIFESMVSTFGNSASFKGTPGALTTPLFKGDRLASSSSLAFDFSDDENETSTPKVKRSRPSVLSESDLRRKLLEKELKYLEKKTEFFDRISPKIETLVDNASKYYKEKLKEELTDGEKFVIEEDTATNYNAFKNFVDENINF